jgi:uncharacterized radical SAM protein YgiQ
LYRRISKLENVKKITIGSGIRYDIHVRQWDKNASHKDYLKELMVHHVSGRLKVAPEHLDDEVLGLMRKPSFSLFKKFAAFFDSVNRQHNLNQQLIPYFISNHPGSTVESMVELASELKQLNIKPEQVQDFTPTPMTLASVMYYTGLNPYSLKPVYVAKNIEERHLQKDIFFWYIPEKRKIILQKLVSLQKFHLVKKIEK